MKLRKRLKTNLSSSGMTLIERLRRSRFSRSMELAQPCDNHQQHRGKVGAKSKKLNLDRSLSGWQSSKQILAQDSHYLKSKSDSAKVHLAQEHQLLLIVIRNRPEVFL